MKKNLLLAALAATTLLTGLTSCSSDSDNENVIGNDDVVKTQAEAYALINGAYGPYQTLSSTFTSMVDTPTELGTSYLGNEEDNVTKMVTLEYDKDNSYPKKTFNALYKSIGTVNDAIEKINASKTLTNSEKVEPIGRAKFLRGLFYSWLVVLWGEVPLRLTVDDANVTTRSSIDEVYSQIVKDLTEAADALPASASTPVTPTKGAAYALLTRVYLQWASNPLTQAEVEAIKTSRTDPASTPWNTSRLQKVIEYADKVDKLGVYSLQPNFKDLFGLANESKGPEQIFTIQHEGDGIDAQGNHQNHCAWTYPFQETTEVIHIQPIHTFEDWPNDDPRKAFSIVTSITDPRDGSVHTYAPPVTLPAYGKGVDRSTTTSVYTTQLYNYVDRIELRYAEVLLNKAEALVQLGRNEEATEPLDKIRQRGFGDTAHHIHAPTLADIQKEWEYEFIYEQRHWQNLTRWKNLIATVLTVKDFQHYDDSYAVAGQKGADGNVVNAYFARIHRFLKAKYEHVNGHFYRFPIPYGSNNEELGITPQNPGYSD
jgi:hypothetical protein